MFSAFDEAQVARAIDIAADFMRIGSEGAAPDALHAVLDAYEERRSTVNPDLLEYALMVFITHHPRGTTLTHAVPPMTLRNPELVAPSRVSSNRPVVRGGLVVRAMGMTLAAVGDPTGFAGGALPYAVGQVISIDGGMRMKVF